MNQLKTQVIKKLNVIIELVKHCATKVLPLQDQVLMQEVTLAIVSHEGLCRMLEENGPTENVVLLVNEFGHAIAELYNKIITFKPAPNPARQFSAKSTDKNLLN